MLFSKTAVKHQYKAAVLAVLRPLQWHSRVPEGMMKLAFYFHRVIHSLMSQMLRDLFAIQTP
jgi:hypothetical protein